MEHVFHWGEKKLNILISKEDLNKIKMMLCVFYLTDFILVNFGLMSANFSCASS